MKALLNRLWLAIAKPLKQSFQRFPEALIVSFLLGTLLVFNNELAVFIGNQPVIDTGLIDVSMILNDLNQSLFIVLPLMISLSLMIERFPIFKTYRLALIITMVVMGGLYFTFLRLENSLVVEFNRFSNLVFAFYGLVIFLPYLMDRQDIGVGIILFFTKLFTSLFYSFVLYIGIFIIILTTNILFGLSINLIVYVNILVLIASFIFLPTLLDSYPKKNDVATVEKDYHMVWQRVFLFVISPVITVFSFLIILYLLTGILNSSGFEPEVYTFSALVIAFVGISSQIALAPFTKTNRLAHLFVKYFHFILMFVMAGYYIQQFISIATTGINLGTTIRLILGVWPFAYAFFVIRKSRVAIHRGLLSLTGAFLFIAAFPGLNAVSLTTLLLNVQLEQTLQRESMISEEGDIIRKPTLELDTYNFLFGTLDEMAMLGLHRFPILPDDYVHPADFEATFGDRERDPVDPDDESLFYSLNLSVVDLSDFSYESLVYVSSLGELSTTPFIGADVSLEFEYNLDDHVYPLTITREGISETLDLYEEIGLVLKERHGLDTFETKEPEELLVKITFETFVVDLWVTSLISTNFTEYKSFSMSFYLGLSSRNG
jgi:hypothetical protein